MARAVERAIDFARTSRLFQCLFVAAAWLEFQRRKRGYSLVQTPCVRLWYIAVKVNLLDPIGPSGN